MTTHNYATTTPVLAKQRRDDAVVRRALRVLEERMRYPGATMANPAASRAFIKLRVADLGHEVFGILFLDTQHRLIADEHLFRGTIDGASVYPREVVKSALMHNAAAVVLYHNHPSGVAEPSLADRQITRRLVDALALVDIRVLDHLVVGAGAGIDGVVSFAERGLL